MKKALLMLVPATLLTSGLLAGGGTYALLTASLTNSGNQFQFESEMVDIDSSPESSTVVMHYAMMASYSPSASEPMFYDHADYPSGLHPYDYSTGYSPDNDSPGGFAPGDRVIRYMNINNKGSATKLTQLSATLDSITDTSGHPIQAGTSAYQDFLNHMRMTVYAPGDNDTTPVYSGSYTDLIRQVQPLATIIYLPKTCSGNKVKFVASMDKEAGNDMQGIKTVLDFKLSAEQVRNNCFDPPFSNLGYSMGVGSTTPIKFELYDSSDMFKTKADDNTRLVITGPKQGGGNLSVTFGVGTGLQINGGHYQANVDENAYPFAVGGTYTASVYDGTTLYGNKQFIVSGFGDGSRRNAP